MNKPNRLDRLNHATQLSHAFGGLFHPRITEAVRGLQSLPGAELEARLPRFVAAALAEAGAIASGLPAGAVRDRFAALARRLIDSELAQLSVLAAERAAQARETTHQTLLTAQIDHALLWPENDARFAQAAENGLSAIETHRALLGHGEERIEYDQARFLSALLSARLTLLATRDIAKAWAVLETHQSWLAPDDLRAVQTTLLRQDRLVRAKTIADALCRFGRPENWRAKAEAAAQDDQPDDADFAALVREMVEARAEVLTAQERNQRRQAANHLLEQIATRHLRHLEEMLSLSPEADRAWSILPDDQRRNLLDRLARNRTGPEPVGGRKALTRHRWAVGLYRHHPDMFAHLDLTAPVWSALPTSDMVTLIRRQSAQTEAGHGSRHRDQSAILRHYAPLWNHRP